MDQSKLDESLFESILTLRAAIGEKNVLQIVHPGKIWSASFRWNDPTTIQSIREIEAQLGTHLPIEIVIFLTKISDGALLYFDLSYGQWGYKIYNSKEIIISQKRWIQLFKESWLEEFVAIGEIVDESHPIIVNPKNLSRNKQFCPLLEGNALDPVGYWSIMSANFHEWIERLITAQGAKYWDWK
jgi:hypothetical protein